MSEVNRYVPSEYMGLAPDCRVAPPYADGCEFVLASDYDALRADRDRLAGELAEARADAERWRFTRSRLWVTFHCGTVDFSASEASEKMQAFRESEIDAARLPPSASGEQT